MAHTPEERDNFERPLCGAKKKNGDRCRAFAGQGVDGNPGVGPCKFHGGATRNHKKHSVELEAKAAMAKLGKPIADLRPGEALLGLLRSSAGHVQWLLDSIQSLDDLGNREAEVLLRMYDGERDRLARIDAACVSAGLKAEEIRLQQDKAASFVKIVHSAARDVGFTPTQLRALGVALRKSAAEASDAPDAADVIREADEKLGKLRREIEDAEARRIRAEASKQSGILFPPEELVPADSAA